MSHCIIGIAKLGIQLQIVKIITDNAMIDWEHSSNNGKVVGEGEGGELGLHRAIYAHGCNLLDVWTFGTEEEIIAKGIDTH